MLGNKPPYTTMQQLNLDWVLSKLKTLLRLVPDDGAVGQILRRTRDGAVWSDEQGGGGGAVQSVNGKTGVVVLDAADVGALPDDYTPPVTSVNGQTGAVVIPTGGAVDSVNGQTGTVVLDAADVGALPDDYTPPVTSVNGQTGAVTVSVPVQSVNGKTGAVVLDAADVGALPDDYTPPITTETRTYVTNSYVDQTAFNRCNAYSIGNIGFFIVNLSINSTSATPDFVTIGTTSLRPYASAFATLPIQNTTQNASIQITSDGLVRFYKGNNSTGFIRTVLAFPIVRSDL